MERLLDKIVEEHEYCIAKGEDPAQFQFPEAWNQTYGDKEWYLVSYGDFVAKHCELLGTKQAANDSFQKQAEEDLAEVRKLVPDCRDEAEVSVHITRLSFLLEHLVVELRESKEQNDKLQQRLEGLEKQSKQDAELARREMDAR